MRTIDTFLPTIRAATNDGRLTWHETSDLIRSSCYETNIGEYIVRISAYNEKDTGEYGYLLTLSKGDLEIDSSQANQFSPKFSDLQQLFQTARRAFFEVDTIIGQLEKEVKRLKAPQPAGM